MKINKLQSILLLKILSSLITVFSKNEMHFGILRFLMGKYIKQSSLTMAAPQNSKEGIIL